jgi:hypothetical protein
MILLPALVGQDHYKVTKQTRISTGLDEAVAVPYEDGVVYITQSTSVGASSPIDSEGRKLFTIFYLKGGQKKPLDDVLVSQRHDGPVSFSGDFKTMVFSQQRPSDTNRDSDPLGLYFAENVDGAWVNIRAYEFNDDFAWLFSPALSKDGRTLFFSANLEDAIGGFDLYRSTLKGGAWTKPENLGPTVNTEKNELYPFFHPTGLLYFSSDGHDNVGGFDLFRTKLVDGAWAQAKRLPNGKFNTLSDDYHISFSEDFKTGYLTSNRRGGTKDIFEITTPVPNLDSAKAIKKTYYKYKIYDRNLDTVDTNLFRYSWVINDTLEIPGHEIIYKFPEQGTYICKLNVFDIQLDTLLEGQTYKTLSIQLNEQAVITCPDTIQVNVPVVFDGSDTFLPGFNVGAYYWEFGDGNYEEGIQATHAFDYPGWYRIILGVQARPQNRRDENPETRESYKDVLVVATD